MDRGDLATVEIPSGVKTPLTSMRGSVHENPDRKAEQGGKDEDGLREFTRASRKIGCRECVALRCYSCDFTRNRVPGRSQGVCCSCAQPTHLRISRCRWKPRKQLLNAPDESFHCLDALRRSGVVADSCSPADFRRARGNYASVHNLTLDGGLLKSVRSAPDRDAGREDWMICTRFTVWPARVPEVCVPT